MVGFGGEGADHRGGMALNEGMTARFRGSSDFFQTGRKAPENSEAGHSSVSSCVGSSSEIIDLSNVLPTFRLLVFRSDRLERWSEIEAPDAISAIHQAAQQEDQGVVELWSDEGKLATLRPVGRHH